MHRDYIGLREKEEKGERKRRERGCWEALPGPLIVHEARLSLPCLLGRNSRSSLAEIPFPGSSQGRSSHCWDVWAVPTCSLTAASFHAGSLGMTKAPVAWDAGSWEGQGSFMYSVRVSQLSEILSFST